MSNNNNKRTHEESFVTTSSNDNKKQKRIIQDESDEDSFFFTPCNIQNCTQMSTNCTGRCQEHHKNICRYKHHVVNSSSKYQFTTRCNTAVPNGQYFCLLHNCTFDGCKNGIQSKNDYGLCFLHLSQHNKSSSNDVKPIQQLCEFPNCHHLRADGYHYCNVHHCSFKDCKYAVTTLNKQVKDFCITHYYRLYNTFH